MTKTQRDNHRKMRLERAAIRQWRRGILNGFASMNKAIASLPRAAAGASLHFSIFDEARTGFDTPPMPPVTPQLNVLRASR